jgi:hypothetical protein
VGKKTYPLLIKSVRQQAYGTSRKEVQEVFIRMTAKGGLFWLLMASTGILRSIQELKQTTVEADS